MTSSECPRIFSELSSSSSVRTCLPSMGPASSVGIKPGKQLPLELPPSLAAPELL